MISISKINHKGKTRIKINFPFDYSIIQKIKTLPTARFSKSLKAWHIEYSKTEYNLLKALNLELKVEKNIGTTDIITSKGVHTDIKSSDLTSGVFQSDKQEKPDIQINKSGIKILLNNLKFIIKFSFDLEKIDFVKQLEGAYWNKKSFAWIAKATIKNLEELQSHFKYWDEQKYFEIKELVALGEAPQTVELYRTPDNPKNFWVKLKGYKIDVEFLKHIPNRNYDSRYKRWSIEYDESFINRIVDHYQSKGAKIINRLPNKNLNGYTKGLTYREKQNNLIAKFNTKNQALVRKTSDTLIGQRYSWSTINSYVGAIVRYSDYLKGKDIEEATSEDANNFINKISLGRVSESKINGIVSAIKFYYTKVIFRPDFEIQKIKRPRKGRYLPQILSIGEIQRILQALNNLKHITILFTLYNGGLRLSEILNLRVDDLNFERNQIFIRAGKGKKDRVVMLSNTLKEILIMYTEQYKPIFWLFEGQDKEGQYSQKSVQAIVKAATKKAGITKHVTPHKIRHCFATHLLDGGTDIRYIQELLGHKDIKTTLIYTHVTTRNMTEIISPLDKLDFNDKKTK